MKLHFSPLACSMATRIACYEADLPLELVHVDSKTKRLHDGTDYLALHPLGLVPSLVLDDGSLLTENAAILHHLADRAGGETLAPRDAAGRDQLRRWLAFIGSELHKSLFTPLLDRHAPPEVHAYALAKGTSRLAYLAAHLEGRKSLLERFSVADGYLFTVLNWAQVTPVDLSAWPAIGRYQAALLERPSVARAFAEELTLFQRAG